MKDHVEAGEGGITCADGVAAMAYDGNTELVGGVADQFEFIRCPRGVFLRPVLPGRIGRPLTCTLIQSDPLF